MQKITVAKGDGIGPEIMDGCSKNTKECQQAQVSKWEEVEYWRDRCTLQGNTSGIR